jgi:hypothetical protein
MPPSSLDYVQHAIEDLVKARGSTADELRYTVDTAIERLRKATSEMQAHAGDEAPDLDERLEHATEAVRRDLGRRAVAAQQTRGALHELVGAIRTRWTELA